MGQAREKRLRQEVAVERKKREKLETQLAGLSPSIRSAMELADRVIAVTDGKK